MDTAVQNIGPYPIMQSVTIIRIRDEDTRQMYLALERYIGKDGVVLNFDYLKFDDAFCVEDLGLPRFMWIYTVKLQDGDIVQVPGEMVSHASN